MFFSVESLDAPNRQAKVYFNQVSSQLFYAKAFVQECKELFETNANRNKIVKNSSFFYKCKDAFLVNAIFCLCRMLEEETTGKYQNLSLKRVINEACKIQYEKTTELTELLNPAKEALIPLKDFRDKKLAHLDLSVFESDQELGFVEHHRKYEINTEVFDKIFELLQNLLNLLFNIIQCDPNTTSEVSLTPLDILHIKITDNWANNERAFCGDAHCVMVKLQLGEILKKAIDSGKLTKEMQMEVFGLNTEEGNLVESSFDFVGHNLNSVEKHYLSAYAKRDVIN